MESAGEGAREMFEQGRETLDQGIDTARDMLGVGKYDKRSPAVAFTQGIYYVAAGAWPLVHMRSFERVTGRKHDRWLARTVGGLSAVIGGALGCFGFRGHRSAREMEILGIGSALVFAAIDLAYAGRRRISRAYLADALVELGLAGFWWAAHRRRASAGGGGLLALFGERGSGERVTDSIIVRGDVGHIYRLWTDFERFPRFMEDIKSVERTGDRTSHWVARGPLGKDLEWDAEITRLEENKRIAWNSTGGDLKTSGQVTFNELPHGDTEVTVMLLYVPPAGPIGTVLSKGLDDPHGKVLEGLRSFKRFAEGVHAQRREPDGSADKEARNP